jgi:hypothetical protein
LFAFKQDGGQSPGFFFKVHRGSSPGRYSRRSVAGNGRRGKSLIHRKPPVAQGMDRRTASGTAPAVGTGADSGPGWR